MKWFKRQSAEMRFRDEVNRMDRENLQHVLDENNALSDSADPVLAPGTVGPLNCNAGVIVPSASDPYHRTDAFARVKIGGNGSGVLAADMSEEALRGLGDWFHVVADRVAGTRRVMTDAAEIIDAQIEDDDHPHGYDIGGEG